MKPATVLELRLATACVVAFMLTTLIHATLRLAFWDVLQRLAR